MRYGKNYIDKFTMMQDIYAEGRRPEAYAIIRGSESYPNINGFVTFSRSRGGTWVEVEVRGLPEYMPAIGDRPPIGPFGFHIHEEGSCMPHEGSDAFSHAQGHYNPGNQPHGNHAGDFPVLFSNSGYSRMGFFTDRFSPRDVIGRAVIIHLHPDDYRSQPAGNSGERIACGEISEVKYWG